MTALFLVNSHTITPIISRITGKITCTGTSNFTFNSLNSSVLKVLGFCQPAMRQVLAMS